MELLRDDMIRVGASDDTVTQVRGAGDQFHPVTLAQLRDVVIPEMVA